MDGMYIVPMLRAMVLCFRPKPTGTRAIQVPASSSTLLTTWVSFCLSMPFIPSMAAAAWYACARSSVISWQGQCIDLMHPPVRPDESCKERDYQRNAELFLGDRRNIFIKMMQQQLKALPLQLLWWWPLVCQYLLTVGQYSIVWQSTESITRAFI